MKYLNTFGLLAICLCLIVGSNIIFYSPIHLYDLITGLQPADFSITWPGIRIFIEPFYSFAFYILALNRDFYKPVVISWILWVLGVVFVYCLIYKKSVKQMLVNMAYSVMILFTVFSFVALIPIPGPKLEKPKGYIAVDIHSHTLRSHDNVAPESISLKAHLWQGFDAFFNTEHNHSKGFLTFPADTRYKIVYPGMQMRTKDGVSVVLLSQKEFNGYDYENMFLEDLIKKAHENNMFVVMPHWWKWHEHTFAKLKDIGIDGFEIYNCGYRYFDKNEQKSMISFAKENNLTMFGVTDWHGWGYMSDVWTVFEGNTLENIEIQLLKKPKTKVLLYRGEQSGSVIRFIFEPFYAFYYYISNVTSKYLISFTIWIIVVFLIFKSRFFKYIKKYLPVFMAVVCVLVAIYFCIIVRAFIDTNTIVMKSVIPALAGFCVLWLILCKSNNNNCL
ncbi:hypothetical protein AGMMS49990_07220 [Endomicrobiia bacterium]|nr:hypothetical protein AGMMS49990_07220 [Endomicrobiia bacterium]